MLATLIGDLDLINKYKSDFLENDIGVSLIPETEINILSNTNFENYDLYRADILVCLCSKDQLNFYLIEMAKTLYSTPYIITLSNNMNNYDTFINAGANEVISLELIIQNAINKYISILNKN